MGKTVCFPLPITFFETCMSTICEVCDKLVTGVTRTDFVPTMRIIFGKDLIVRRSNLNHVSIISSRHRLYALSKAQYSCVKANQKNNFILWLVLIASVGQD